MYGSYSDERLADLLQQQDQKAYAEIYKRYFDRLYVHAFGMLKEDTIAADVVQDVFEYLWSHLEVPIKISLSAYLHAITRHAVLKVIRRTKVADRFRLYLEKERTITHSVATDTKVILNELQVLIDSEISKLPIRMREVFELRYRENRSNQEIAVSLGISSNTVKNHMVNSLRILRARLGRFIFLLIISML